MKKSLVYFAALTILASATLGFAADPAPAPAAPAVAAPVPPPPPPKAVTPGDNVAAWTALSADGGQTVTSASLAGKNYALVFVNASCSACRGELTELAQRQFGDDLTVLIASVDIKPDKVAGVYKDTYKLPYNVLDDSKMELSAKFDFAFTPATVIVGKDGKLIARFLGFSPALRVKLFEAFDKYTKK